MTKLQQQIWELRKLGVGAEDIARRLNCNQSYIYRTTGKIRNPNVLQRLVALEEMVAEGLVILRQLSRLPKSVIDQRIKELDRDLHTGVIEKVTKP